MYGGDGVDLCGRGLSEEPVWSFDSSPIPQVVALIKLNRKRGMRPLRKAFLIQAW